MARKSRFDYQTQFGGFDTLMPFRVRDILMVATPYDAFVIADDDKLTEIIFNEYLDLNLRYAPHVTRVSTRAEALRLMKKRKFDLVIAMARVGRIDIGEFARAAKKLHPEAPVVLLAYNMLDIQRLGEKGRKDIDRTFLWTGDVRILMSIIKHFEDRRNIDHDIERAEVQAILLVEDSVRFYSYYLPLIYTELMRQTQGLIAEGVNLSHKLLRMRARPKILHASTFEGAWKLYQRYKHHLLATITDVRFSWRGRSNAKAGFELLSRIKSDADDLPVLCQSSNERWRKRAETMGAAFLNKGAQDLPDGIRLFLKDHCGFGDFVFRLPTGEIVGGVADLHTMVDFLKAAPIESIAYHASRNHFSKWLMARTEFDMAYKIRPKHTTEFQEPEDLRDYLVDTLGTSLHKKQLGVVGEFSRRFFKDDAPFVRIGRGSLGGKGRGLAFLNQLLSKEEEDSRRWPGIRIRVPNAAVLGTEVFDAFVEQNGLARLWDAPPDDEVTREAFTRARLPVEVRWDLQTFISKVRWPLAVRSSSLMEDSAVRPFAGIYDTYMIPNSHPDPSVRLDRLCRAIQMVYASVFSKRARTYLGSTAHLVHQEKMAVILQRLAGTPYQDRFYPDFSGVAQSYNYYPVGQIKSSDGIAHIALGLGETIVQGHLNLRFSPNHPENLFQFSSLRDMLSNSQHEFMALDISRRDFLPGADPSANLLTLGLKEAEADGTLHAIGSTYDPQNDRVYDGIHRKGARLVTFANILKNDVFPLAEILCWLFEFGTEAMGSPVEFEFAVNLKAKEFNILQMRPMISWTQAKRLNIDPDDTARTICYSPRALGHGHITGVYDIIYTKPEAFDSLKTRAIAAEIGHLNEKLRKQGRGCMLIGPGRWGSADPNLGIPVAWDDISEAKLIVETTLPDFVVEPSYGTHFLHNVISLEIGYLTVRHDTKEGRIDWDWLASCEAIEETGFVRHIRLPAALDIRIDGKQGRGAVLRPD